MEHIEKVPKTRARKLPAESPAEAKPAVRRRKKVAIAHEERHGMIADAAYFRSQKRGASEQGDHFADWLAAEAEIDAIISGSQR